MFTETGYNRGRKLEESPLHEIPFSWGMSFAMVKIHVTGLGIIAYSHLIYLPQFCPDVRIYVSRLVQMTPIRTKESEKPSKKYDRPLNRFTYRCFRCI